MFITRDDQAFVKRGSYVKETALGSLSQHECTVRLGLTVASSVSKPEVQSLVTLICGSGKVFFFLLGAHSIPFLCPCSIHPDIERLCPNEKKYVVHTDSNKNSVANSVHRFIIISVDLIAAVSMGKQKRKELDVHSMI